MYVFMEVVQIFDVISICIIGLRWLLLSSEFYHCRNAKMKIYVIDIGTMSYDKKEKNK